MVDVTGDAMVRGNEAVAHDGIWSEVKLERIRAHMKHGLTSMESSDALDATGRRLRILVEEVGEVAKEFNEAEHDQRMVDAAALRKELIQVAAMAGAWADALGEFLRECVR